MERSKTEKAEKREIGKAGNRHYRIEEATQAHVDALKGRLRQADLDEIAAGCGRDPDAVLEISWRMSELRWAMIIRKVGNNGQEEDLVACIAGAARPTLASAVGVPWMLGSRELDREGLPLGRESRQYVQVMRERFHFLENRIDARQKRAIHWLRWLGFKIEPATPWGAKLMPFHPFWMRGAAHV